MKTGIEEIDNELKRLADVEEFEDFNAFIEMAIRDNIDNEDITVVEYKTGHIDLWKAYFEQTAILFLKKIGKYIRYDYIYSTEGYDEIEFVKEVFAYPKKTIKYL